MCRIHTRERERERERERGKVAMGRSKYKDRAYQTATEWKTEGGGFKRGGVASSSGGDSLPFHCCALSFAPFTDPVMLLDGDGGADVFEITALVPFIQKHGTNPVTGKKTSLRDVLAMKFHRNNDGYVLLLPVLSHSLFISLRISLSLSLSLSVRVRIRVRK